jgi:hypothetical protein
MAYIYQFANHSFTVVLAAVLCPVFPLNLAKRLGQLDDKCEPLMNQVIRELSACFTLAEIHAK